MNNDVKILDLKVSISLTVHFFFTRVSVRPPQLAATRTPLAPRGDYVHDVATAQLVVLVHWYVARQRDTVDRGGTSWKVLVSDLPGREEAHIESIFEI